jgi:hypothetical protein
MNALRFYACEQFQLDVLGVTGRQSGGVERQTIAAETRAFAGVSGHSITIHSANL